MASTEKLAKLKELLSSALTQLRQKLAVVRKHIGNLQTIGQVDQNIKLVCNLLIEIQEVCIILIRTHTLNRIESHRSLIECLCVSVCVCRAM